LFKRNTDILQRFARRRMPNDIAEVEGQEELLQLRQIDIYQGPSDVYEVAFAAGAGYGDPLERDPESVRKDVYLEDISLNAAREIFKVALTEVRRVAARGCGGDGGATAARL
jgi:N-methylhydantoinase B